MSDVSRRRLLSGVPALALGLAGCLGIGDGGDDTANCSPTRTPDATGVAGVLDPRAYPAVPEALSVESATSFATAFETAYRQRRHLSEHGTYWDDVHVQASARETVERDDGIAVLVAGDVKFADTERPADATGTPRPAGTAPFSAWYLVSDDDARRVEADRPFDTTGPPPFDDVPAVACG